MAMPIVEREMSRCVSIISLISMIYGESSADAADAKSHSAMLIRFLVNYHAISYRRRYADAIRRRHFSWISHFMGYHLSLRKQVRD